MSAGAHVWRSRHFRLVFVLLSMAWWSSSYAMHQRWTEQELALLSKVEALEQQQRLSPEDLQVLQSGFEARLDRIRIAAIRVIVLNRQSLRGFWASAKTRPVRGTSAQLLPIVDAAFAPGVDPQRPLIEIVPKSALEVLPKAGTPVPRPIVDGDAPLDQTVLNVLIDDAVRRSPAAKSETVLRKFDAYRLTSEQRARLAGAAK